MVIGAATLPAAAADVFGSGVVVILPASAPEGSSFRLTATYDGSGGAPRGAARFRVVSDLCRGAASIEVTNVAPTLVDVADNFAPLGEPFSLEVDFTDPG